MCSSAVKAAKLGTLDENQRIEFAIEEKQGKTSAINIKKINKQLKIMAGSINKVIIVGNVGNQPEIRLTQASGEELATFSVATSERWKDKSTGE